MASENAAVVEALVDVIDRLLDPMSGCVWNRAQTHRSLSRYVVEEAYELVDAIDDDDRDEIVEELGDVLYQVVLHARIGARTGSFDLADVARVVTEKMTSRHTHVFGDDVATTIAEVEVLWAARKRAEKATRTSPFDGVPRAMPPLERAVKLFERAGTGSSTGTSTGLEATPASRAPVPTADLPAGQRTTDAFWGAELLGIVGAAFDRGIDPVASLRAAVTDYEHRARAAE